MEKERILKALKTIQEVCQEQDTCGTCPIRDANDDCMLRHPSIIPSTWDINFNDAPWRALRN